ncbi:hypothetical protein CC79DRAFT_816772 [Sarocladium strictum]
MLYSWIIALNAMLQRTFAHPTNDGATSRHIWYKPPGKDFSIKYFDVPKAYDDVSVNHADLIGMFDVFADGQIWLMMDGKRLFRFAKGENFNPKGVQHSSEVEIMSPDELREALKTKTSCQEAYDQFIEIAQNQQSLYGAVQRDDSYCEQVQCHESDESRSRG